MTRPVRAAKPVTRDAIEGQLRRVAATDEGQVLAALWSYGSRQAQRGATYGKVRRSTPGALAGWSGSVQ